MNLRRSNFNAQGEKCDRRGGNQALLAYEGGFKVRLSPSEKSCVICLIESPLKMMKNAFYFILKALFVLKMFKFLSRLFDHVGKTA